MNAYLFLNSRPRRFVPRSYGADTEREVSRVAQQLNKRLEQQAFVDDVFRRAMLLERLSMANEDLFAQTLREQKRIMASFRKQEQLCRIQRATTEKKIANYALELEQQMLDFAREKARKQAEERTRAEQAEIQRRNDEKDAFLRENGIEKGIFDQFLLLQLGDQRWEQNQDYRDGQCMSVPTLEEACAKHSQVAAQLRYCIKGK